MLTKSCDRLNALAAINGLSLHLKKPSCPPVKRRSELGKLVRIPATTTDTSKSVYKSAKLGCAVHIGRRATASSNDEGKGLG